MSLPTNDPRTLDTLIRGNVNFIETARPDYAAALLPGGKAEPQRFPLRGKQKETLHYAYPSADECEKIIDDKSIRLWERKINDFDFMKVKIIYFLERASIIAVK